MATTTPLGWKIITFTVVLGLSLTTASGAMVASQYATSEERQGSCIIVDPSGPSVGVNPQCRPVGTPSTPWIEEERRWTEDDVRLFHPTPRPLPFPALQTPWADDRYPLASEVLEASLPGADAELGHHAPLTLDVRLLSSTPDHRGGYVR